MILSSHRVSAMTGFVLSGVLSVGAWWQETMPSSPPPLGGGNGSLWGDRRGGCGRYRRVFVLGQRPTDPLHLLYGVLATLIIMGLGAFSPDKDPRDLLQGWDVDGISVDHVWPRSDKFF